MNLINVAFFSSMIHPSISFECNCICVMLDLFLDSHMQSAWRGLNYDQLFDLYPEQFLREIKTSDPNSDDDTSRKVLGTKLDIESLTIAA